VTPAGTVLRPAEKLVSVCIYDFPALSLSIDSIGTF